MLCHASAALLSLAASAQSRPASPCSQRLDLNSRQLAFADPCSSLVLIASHTIIMTCQCRSHVVTPSDTVSNYTQGHERQSIHFNLNVRVELSKAGERDKQGLVERTWSGSSTWGPGACDCPGAVCAFFWMPLTMSSMRSSSVALSTAVLIVCALTSYGSHTPSCFMSTISPAAESQSCLVCCSCAHAAPHVQCPH